MATHTPVIASDRRECGNLVILNDEIASVVTLPPRPLHNSLFCHSGLDPESRKYLKKLDTGLRRYDEIDDFVRLCKGLPPMTRGGSDCFVVTLLFQVSSTRRIAIATASILSSSRRPRRRINRSFEMVRICSHLTNDFC